jgi:NarL family two-component system response regulator LiaR
MLGLVLGPREPGVDAVSAPITLLIVDDHRMFVDALQLLVGMEDGIEVLGVAGDAETAIELCRSGCPDVVLMDIDLPTMNGIAATREVLKVCPRSQIVVITALMDPDLISRAIEEGACGFVSKQRAGDALVRIVRAAASGETVFLGREMRALAGRLRRAVDGGDPLEYTLTSREVEVLQGLADGMSTEELAAALFLSRRTVQGHVQSILTKLRVRSKLEAVLYAIRHGVVRLRSEPDGGKGQSRHFA